MNKKSSNKFIINFVKNSFHKVESFFSTGNENVVFTEDNKCFPIIEVEIIDTDMLINVLKKITSKKLVSGNLILEIMVDPETGEQLKIKK